MKHFLLILTTAPFLLIAACSPVKKQFVYNKVTNVIIDSFSVAGLEDLPEDLVRFSSYNDSVCFTVESRMKDLCVFKDTSHNKQFHLIQRESGLDSLRSIIIFLKGYKMDNKMGFMIGDYSSRCLNVYNQEFQLLRRNYITYQFPHLADKYFLTASTQLHPAYITGDTLITGITIDDAKQFDNYYAADMFMKFMINGDSISFISTFGKYAAGVRNYYPPISYYTWGSGKAWIAYPAFDTIYTYDIKSGIARKIPIHNPDFIQPKKWVDPAHNDPKYFSKLSRYSTENFNYQGIIFDKHSGNLVLWYKKPHEIKEENGIMKINGKGEWYIIVLNQEGKLLRSYKIDKDTYLPFIFQTSKGLAIPRYQNNLVHEKTVHFDIFNL